MKVVVDIPDAVRFGLVDVSEEREIEVPWLIAHAICDLLGTEHAHLATARVRGQCVVALAREAHRRRSSRHGPFVMRSELLGEGHHTVDELCEYRMLCTAYAAQGWLAATFPVVKSRRHSDGELRFGGGWFIVVAELPTGQVGNHYKAEH